MQQFVGDTFYDEGMEEIDGERRCPEERKNPDGLEISEYQQ